MFKYPKVKQMIGKQGPMPGAPALATGPANPFMAPRSPLTSSTPMGGPTPMSAMGTPRSTLPSIGATANEATPIELGDPKRLNKIATILRMGRK